MPEKNLSECGCWRVDAGCFRERPVEKFAAVVLGLRLAKPLNSIGDISTISRCHSVVSTSATYPVVIAGPNENDRAKNERLGTPGEDWE